MFDKIKRIVIFVSGFILSFSAYANNDRLRLAITTTTDNSGLMSVLNPEFEEQSGIKLDTITTGSGQAFRLGVNGDIDVLLIHSPEAEKKFIEDGHGLKRYSVMQNEFILLGPGADPASVRNARSIQDAFRLVMENKDPFVSRADESGTHVKELSIWNKAGIIPSGDWYQSAGLGMGATLLLANERQAYTMSDRGTFLAYRNKLNLDLLYEGDTILRNPYHVIAVNPKKHPDIKYRLAQQYIDYITGSKAQELIGNFRINGERLFHPVIIAPENNEEIRDKEKKQGFFVDATSKSLRLILDFDQDLFFVVWTSLRISLLAVIFASLISIPLGIIVALKEFRGKKFLMSILNTLMALPTVVVGLLLYGLLNRQGMLGNFGLLYTPTAMVIGQCILIIPIIWNLSIAAVNAADPRLRVTCLSLGANLFQQGLIYINEVRFALMAAIVAGFGRAIGEVGVAMMLGGNINNFTRTMTTAIALETSKGDFEFALALGFMLLLVAFIINLILQQFQELK